MDFLCNCWGCNNIIYFCLFKIHQQKTDGEYSRFFINRHNDGEKVFEHTIGGNINEAVDLAREVQDYLSGNNSSALVSMAIEEMLVNIINTNENVDAIDVIVRDNDEDILISIKDTGVDFNPVAENDNLQFDNISVLNKIAYIVKNLLLRMYFDTHLLKNDSLSTIL